MTTEATVDLILRYAKLGLKDWGHGRRRSTELQGRVRHLLSDRVATEVWQIASVIRGACGGGQGSGRGFFIPMPRDHHASIRQSLFHPRCDASGRVSFDLLILPDEANCLGFRFEPAESPSSTHAYAHLQLCRSLCGLDLPVPPWIPDSYPAFPLPACDTLGMFLCLTTSVHGYGERMGSVLGRMYATPSDLQKQLVRLKEVLGRGGSN